MSRDLLSEVLSSLGVFVLERAESGEFRSLGPVPPWAAAWLGIESEEEGAVSGSTGAKAGALVDVAALSPFLENFLVDAEVFWRSGAVGRLHSGLWSEQTPGGGDSNFDAQAIRLEDGSGALLIQELDHSFKELFRLLQQARSANLDHHRLRREVDRKEVLLHCIVHDLKGPLSGMMGGYSLLNSKQLAPERQDELVSIGLRHARKQNAMIDRILGIFAAELEALEAFHSDRARAPSVYGIAREVLRTHEPSFRDSGVAVELDSSGVLSDDPELATRVVGQKDRLERVLLNLLENAIRHSPSRGTVQVVVRTEGQRVLLSVQDRGPGVPEDEVHDIFDRFRSGARPGSSGLGLYFCRLAVRPWGGTVSYAARPGGGAEFTIGLIPAT